MRRYESMTREKSAQMHAAKERKRMESAPLDYPAPLDYSAPVQSIRISDYRTGEIHQLVLFHSRRRIGCYRVSVNGKPWKQSIGYDRMLRGLRTALHRHTT